MSWFALVNEVSTVVQQLWADDATAAAVENDWPVELVRAIDGPGDVLSQRLGADGWADDAVLVEAQLIDAIREEYLAALAALTTAGKEQVYQAKAEEVGLYSGGYTDERALPFATAEAAARGLSVADVIAEYLDGMDRARAAMAAIEARWIKARAAITGALTVADKRDAALIWREDFRG